MPEPQYNSLRILLPRLWHHISSHRRWQFALLMGLTTLSSFAEIVSLSAVIPFIGIITQPETVFKSTLISGVIHSLGIIKSTDLLIPLTIAFLVASLLAGGLRILLVWVGVRLGNVTGADLSVEVFRRTLFQPYSVHVSRSSSEIISGMTQKIGSVTGVISAVISINTSGMMFAAIMITLFAIDPMVAGLSVVIFGSAYVFIACLTRKRVAYNGQRCAQEQSQVIKIIQEGLGGIRDVLLDGTQAVYCDLYRKSVTQLQRGVSENVFIAAAPRYAMEALGMVLIAILVLAINYRSGNAVQALPILGVLALSAQRSLPLMQQLYCGWSSILGGKAELTDVLTLLDQPLPVQANLPEPEPLALRQFIRFDNVSFQYNCTAPWVLDGINLTIPKGARVGVIGSTGSGKSTALDLMMGLLKPSLGQIVVDGQAVNFDHQRAWQRTVAHVPQSIFLSDATIAENIAFGIPKDQINFDHVRNAAQQARVADFIESRPEAYNAFVGERGVRLSGGQRQRIGIARALYKQASVLVFDEATSALDNETEQAVMQAIEALSEDLTLIIIAHRLTTLKNCTQIVELADGVIKRTGTYAEIVSKEKANGYASSKPVNIF